MNEQKRGMPLVTVITPTYNRASFLDETISSVLGQEYPHLEYLILDDGSTDNTEEIVQKYLGKARYENHANMGETRTVNKGLKMARGEIIVVVNSDDPLLPGAITDAVEVLTQNRDALVAYPDWYLIDEQSRILQRRKTFDYDYVSMVKWHCCLPGPGTFFRRSLVDQLRGRDEQFRYVADFDFWLRAGLIGPFVRIPRTLATFRWHSDGASSSKQGLSMAEEHIRLVDKIYSIPGLKEDVLAVRKKAFSSAYHEAAVVLGDTELARKKEYFLRAIALSPPSYLLRWSRLAEPIVLILLGRNIYPSVRRTYSKLHRKVMRSGKVKSIG